MLLTLALPLTLIPMVDRPMVGDTPLRLVYSVRQP